MVDKEPAMIDTHRRKYTVRGRAQFNSEPEIPPARGGGRVGVLLVTPCDEASSGLVQRRGDRCRKCSGQSTSTLVGKPFDVA